MASKASEIDDARGQVADAVKAALQRMQTDALQGLSRSQRTDAQSSTAGQCPVCGTPLDGIACDGPTGYTADPCGHSLGQLTVSALARDSP